MRGCLIALAVLAALAVAAAIAGPLFILPATTTSSRATPLAEVTVSTESAASLDEKIGGIETVAASTQATSKPTPVTLRVTEQELTSKAAELISRSSGHSQYEAKNVQIHLLPGEVLATASVRVSGFDLPLTIKARVEAEDGKPKVTVTEADLGPLPLPGNLKDQIVSVFQTELSQIWVDSPVEIQEIRIEQGMATITGLAKPTQ